MNTRLGRTRSALSLIFGLALIATLPATAQAQYQEAPTLAALVASGDLPAVAERLPASLSHATASSSEDLYARWVRATEVALELVTQKPSQNDCSRLRRHRPSLAKSQLGLPVLKPDRSSGT